MPSRAYCGALFLLPFSRCLLIELLELIGVARIYYWGWPQPRVGYRILLIDKRLQT